MKRKRLLVQPITNLD